MPFLAGKRGTRIGKMNTSVKRKDITVTTSVGNGYLESNDSLTAAISFYVDKDQKH